MQSRYPIPCLVFGRLVPALDSLTTSTHPSFPLDRFLISLSTLVLDHPPRKTRSSVRHCGMSIGKPLLECHPSSFVPYLPVLKPVSATVAAYSPLSTSSLVCAHSSFHRSHNPFPLSLETLPMHSNQYTFCLDAEFILMPRPMPILSSSTSPPSSLITSWCRKLWV